MKTHVTVSANALAIVGSLGNIGLKAIEYQVAVEARKQAATKFGEACSKWKAKHGYEFIKKHTAEWELMLDSLPNEVWALISSTKRNERNARDRLFRACRKAAAS